MLLIRELEGRLASFSEEGLIFGSTHPSIGLEAVAVGVSLALEVRDKIVSTHRGHHHSLAKGASPDRLLAEIFGRETGYCGGKGGSMHVADAATGNFGTNAIVGASIGLATGAALASAIRGDGTVAVAYFGDGAINQGLFHESLNLASIWDLPCIYVCENNHFAQGSAISDMVNVENLSVRAAGYGLPGIAVDGMDVFSVWEAASSAVARARRGEGPSLIVADCWRYGGHMVGDTEVYRTKEEGLAWAERDPIAQLTTALSAHGTLATRDLKWLEVSAQELIDEAETFARKSAFPPPETARIDVYGTVSVEERGPS